MVQEENSVQKEIDWSKWYDFLGESGSPIVHLGGVVATSELLGMFEFTEKSRVLDVGCGTGLTAYEIAKRYGSEVVGIDISEKMIASAKRRLERQRLGGKVDFRVADIFKLPFDDESFDAVLTESLLNALPEKPRAMSEIVRVTRLKGLVGANEGFALPSTPPELLDRVVELTGAKERLPTPEQWRRLFEDSGLQVVQMAEKRAVELNYFSPEEVWRRLRSVGLSRIPSLYWRMLTDPNIRRLAMSTAKGTELMFSNKDTKDFFGMVLILGKKKRQ